MSYDDGYLDLDSRFISDDDSDDDFFPAPTFCANQSFPSTENKDFAVKYQYAAEYGDLDELITARKEGNIPIDQPLENGWTALMYACYQSQPDIVRYLLNNGADPNYCHEGLTPLIKACSNLTNNKISNYACVNLLIVNKASVNEVNRFFQTPLMLAIQNEKDYIASFLIPLTDLNLRDGNGQTAIFYAVKYERITILKQLLELNVEEKNNSALINMAKFTNNEEIINLLSDPVKIELDKRYNLMMKELATESWCEMFPNILYKSRPAYFYEVANILNSIYCENLIFLFRDQNIDLKTFLALTDEDLQNLHVMYPYQRKLILKGIKKFHMYPWNPNAKLCLRIAEINILEFVNNVALLWKHMTVTCSSFKYLNKNIDVSMKKALLTTANSDLKDFDLTIRKIKSEIKIARNVLHEIKKHTVPPGDLIKPKPVKKNIINKKRFMFISAVIVVVITTVKLQFK